MIKWKDEYCTGIDLIDEQHRRLFEIANSAYELLNNKLYVDKYDRIMEILKELKDYTVFHFSSEEGYMKSIGYKKFLSHKVMHDDFIERINNLDLNDLDENQDKYISEILDFIVDWISDHILGTDKKMARNE